MVARNSFPDMVLCKVPVRLRPVSPSGGRHPRDTRVMLLEVKVRVGDQRRSSSPGRVPARGTITADGCQLPLPNGYNGGASVSVPSRKERKAALRAALQDALGCVLIRVIRGSMSSVRTASEGGSR